MDFFFNPLAVRIFGPEGKQRKEMQIGQMSG